MSKQKAPFNTAFANKSKFRKTFLNVSYNAAKECGSKGITIDLETRSMKMSVDWTIHLFIIVIVDLYTFD